MKTFDLSSFVKKRLMRRRHKAGGKMSALVSQAEKAARFQALHRRPGAFVVPNPWDAGSARILASLGFEALATTSGGLAVTLGLRDGAVTREQALAHVVQ